MLQNKQVPPWATQGLIEELFNAATKDTRQQALPLCYVAWSFGNLNDFGRAAVALLKASQILDSQATPVELEKARNAAAIIVNSIVRDSIVRDKPMFDDEDLAEIFLKAVLNIASLQAAIKPRGRYVAEMRGVWQRYTHGMLKRGRADKVREICDEVANSAKYAVVRDSLLGDFVKQQLVDLTS